jgi:hypothetical protein
MDSASVGSARTGLRIGVTIGLHAEAESLWVNGIKQNALYLVQALRRSALVQSVCLVNTTAVNITAALPWDLTAYPTLPFDAAKDTLDVLIELGGQIDGEQTDYLKQRGTRLVSYCCGVEYVNGMESILFGKKLWGSGLFINPRYDGLWVIPQIAPSTGPYLSATRRLPATVVPFVWSPSVLEEQAARLPNGGRYTPHPGPKRLTVMEPNLNVVKFCLYPVLIADEAFRQAPDRIAHLHVTNADHLARDSQEFVALLNHVELVRQHKAAFVGRHQTPQFLAEHTDIVVSHQWENALNYFYLEVCWLGYPLVHNAHLVSDLGYFYKDNDVPGAAQKLLWAMEHHDALGDTYAARQRARIGRFLPTDRHLIESYERLLLQLMATPLR